MNGIIIYQSSCGSTREYAEWISEGTGFECCTLKEVQDKALDRYDIVIAGSFVIAGKITIGRWIDRKWDILKNKEVVVFSTSGARPSPELASMLMKNSFSEEVASRVRLFPMHGRRRQKDLSLTAKIMLWIAATFIAKTPEEKEDMRKEFDGVDRAWTHGLVEHITTLTATMNGTPSDTLERSAP